MTTSDATIKTQAPLAATSAATSRQARIGMIETLFSEPPSLLSVARGSAQAYLDKHFAGQNFAAYRLVVGTPRPLPDGSDEPPYYDYHTLPQLVVERMAGATRMQLMEHHHRVAGKYREVYVPGGPPLADIERLINQCGALLASVYTRSVKAWWVAPQALQVPRWGVLSNHLLALLHDSPKPPGMSDDAFAALLPKALVQGSRPDSQWSLHGGSVSVDTVHVLGEGQSAEQARMLPILLLSQSAKDQRQRLLFSPASGIQALDSLDDLAALLPAFTGTLPTETAGQWFVQPVQGDPFDALAASYLARQLRELASIDLKVPRTAEHYQALLSYILDARRWFVPRLTPFQQRVRSEMPLWLAHAGHEDAIAHARLLQKQVLALHENAGKHFLEGIDPIETFAENGLRQCLKAQPKAANVEPADITLRFDRVIATAVPVPGGFIAGEVQPITLTLAQLAMENLVGLPHAPKSITLKGAKAPAWLTYEVLKACVSKVDVGQAYPGLLKKNLLDDPVESARRRQVFSRQLRVQLPMLALALKIKGEHGLTQAGFQRVQAALQPTEAERRLAGQAMALWPLAFKASAAAEPDEVATMFIIGPRDGQDGAHVLYRPLFSPMLQEYESIEALFDAIKAPGDLQDSVLTWIAPRRYAVYANRGFYEPHIRHFLPGDEFALYEKPAPAQLSKQVNDEDPTSQVFTATANALVALADQQSVSNTEQRWANLKTLGWLLFGSVLPFIRGPLMLGGWLFQLVDSLQHDIPALLSDDSQVTAISLMDVLINLMVILAHQATPSDVQRHLELEHPVFADLALAKPLTAFETPVPIEQIPAPAAYTQPGGWANARNVLTAQQQARLRSFSLKAFSEPWPSTLEGAETSGARQGLFHDQAQVPRQWQALVRGHLYRVDIKQGLVRVISADGSTQGPWLKHLGKGQWDFDLGLRLRGGADESLERFLHNEQAYRQALEGSYTQASLGRARANVAMEVARGVALQPEGTITEQARKQAQQRYSVEVENKLTFAQQELHDLKALRSLGPREHYETDLIEALESVIRTTWLLSDQTRTQMVERNDKLLPLLDLLHDASEEEAESETNIQSALELKTIMHELAGIYERAIRWRTLEKTYMDELNSVSVLGWDKAQELAGTLAERPSIEELQTLQLTTLWGNAINVSDPKFADELFASVIECIKRARMASKSVSESHQMKMTTAERIELLENADSIYAQTDDQIEFWRAMEPEKFDLASLEKLQELLTSMHHQVEKQLSELLQPQPEAPRRPKAKPTPKPGASGAGARRKKLIRTRNRDMYIAQISELTEQPGVETAQVLDSVGAVIGTFTEADDGVWEQTPEERPPQPDPQLGELLNKSQPLLRDVTKAIEKVQTMIPKANEPASLEELLQAQARTRSWAADAIAAKRRRMDTSRLATTQLNRARTLEADLRAAAQQLEEAGLNARIEAIRNNLENPNDIAFLQARNEVRIVREGSRVALRGRDKDFLQVYAVLDARTGQPLCYAHFHYERSQGPDDHFTAAHIKTLQQERLGRQAQADVEAQAFASMRTGQTGRVQQTLVIRRSNIALPLARTLFFSAD